MNVLNMSVKTVFFEPIRQRAKKTEYRDYSDYWIDKLIDRGNMSIAEVMDGLIDGTLEPKWKPYDHILFHESGGLNRTLLVEMLGVKTYMNHRTFCIKLGEIIDKNVKEG